MHTLVLTESTWTPQIQGSTGNPTLTYTTQQGHYTRIGNVVIYWGYIAINAISVAGTGDLRLTLPVTASASVTSYTGSCFWYDSSANEHFTGTLLVPASTTYGRVVDEASTTTSRQVSTMGNGDILQYSGSYKV